MPERDRAAAAAKCRETWHNKDQAELSAVSSARTKKAWAEGKYDHLKDLWTPERRAAHAGVSSRIAREDTVAAIREFAARKPRPPWKVLQAKLGVSQQTLWRWRVRLKIVKGRKMIPLDGIQEQEILAFANSVPRPPWKVLANKLGMSTSTLERRRKTVGLGLDSKIKMFTSKAC